eukprot:scaffold2789_cov51-Phaeocystis_antarctica.AAC.1
MSGRLQPYVVEAAALGASPTRSSAQACGRCATPSMMPPSATSAGCAAAAGSATTRTSTRRRRRPRKIEPEP